MKHSSIVALMATVAAAAPYSGVHHSLSARETNLCQNAPNCELYDTPDGTRLRFVPGQEPGTAAYNSLFGIANANTTQVVRREDKVEGHVTIGKTRMNYGSILPEVAMANITERCSGVGSCDQTPLNLPVDTGGDVGQLELETQGQFNSIQDRDNFVAAIVAVAKQGTENDKVKTCTGGGPNAPLVCQDTILHHQSGSISVNRFVNGNLQGFIDVKATLKKVDDAWCKVVFAVAAGIIGEVSSVGSGFFGALADPVCDP